MSEEAPPEELEESIRRVTDCRHEWEVAENSYRWLEGQRYWCCIKCGSMKLPRPRKAAD